MINPNTKGCITIILALPWRILSCCIFLFFLMTAMASTSMLTTCMSFPMVVLMVRTLHIRIILKCFIDKSFYRFICISWNSSEKLNSCSKEKMNWKSLTKLSPTILVPTGKLSLECFATFKVRGLSYSPVAKSPSLIPKSLKHYKNHKTVFL